MSLDTPLSDDDQTAPVAEQETASLDDLGHDELQARVELLREENDRLRRSYVRARTASYRRTALGFALTGVLALGGAVFFPDARTVLFALAGTGLFAGVLTYYLTPERFVSGTVGEDVYEALAANGRALRADLGLQDTTVYLPTRDDVSGPARLFVPARSAWERPDDDALADPFVVGESPATRGVSLVPSAGSLFEEFQRATTAGPTSDPAGLADQAVDALVHQFELLDDADADVDRAEGRITLAVDGGPYGAVDDFDHPVASFAGVVLAVGLDRPVTVETTADQGGRHDYLVTCRWDEEGDPTE